MTKLLSSINEEKQFPGNFKPANSEININDDSLIFAFVETDLLLLNDEIPTFSQFKTLNTPFNFSKYIGQIANLHCHVVSIKPLEKIPKSVVFIALRAAFTQLPEDYLRAAIYSHQLLLWNKRTQYCGACGAKTIEPESTDLVKECSNCHENYYPKISPAVIVAISNQGKLLMAQHGSIKSIRYTILAGFVNPGESLEECLHREVFEEAGIEIENISYFGSQTWPFPDSLMIGFKAEYKSGELRPDFNEIMDLKWFKPSEIPDWENRTSISRALIDNFIEENS